jgi:ferritin-like metal-binding protein YciE
MKIDNHTIISLSDMLILGGRNVVNVEENIEEALTGWILKIGSKALKEELEHYLFDIRSHQKDLMDCYKNSNIVEDGGHSMIIKAYISETKETLGACLDTRISDVYLIYAIQAINHYKIHLYGTLAAYADTLGQKKTAEIYHKAMLDEKVADIRLSNIAERKVNVSAKAI